MILWSAETRLRFLAPPVNTDAIAADKVIAGETARAIVLRAACKYRDVELRVTPEATLDLPPVARVGPS